MVRAVDARRKKDPENHKTTANAKLLAQIFEVAFNRIPQNPEDKRYRQGDTLGDEYKHWFREKFGNGRFRLFFRFEKRSKILVYAWVNDETTLRTRGSKSVAYAVFAKMLDGGNPPDGWSALVAACTAANADETLTAIQQVLAAADEIEKKRKIASGCFRLPRGFLFLLGQPIRAVIRREREAKKSRAGVVGSQRAQRGPSRARGMG